MNTALALPLGRVWAEFDAAACDTLASVASSSQRIYEHDLRVFVAWMREHELTPDQLSRSHLIMYQSDLRMCYPQQATAARMMAVVRSMLAHYAVIAARPNPAVLLKPIRVADETTHTALTREQAHELLGAIDQSTLIGKRDYALVLLLLRAGLRRSECAALNIGDLQVTQGHRVAIVRHGKGNKRRIVKIAPDVHRAIQAYLEAAGRTGAPSDSPLFVRVRRGGHATEERLGDKSIERIVKALGAAIGVDLTPHGLRASFVTLAFEGGASLQQVQYAAGHKNPATTLRYHARKSNLDDNAVDYLDLGA